MDPEERLQQQLNEYQELAKENKNIDVAALMVSALRNQNENTNAVPPRQRHIAYLVSLALPPFCLLFVLKYYFSDEDDAQHVAIICLLLTVVSVFMAWLIVGSMLKSSGVSVDQLQQTPGQLLELTK